MPSPQKPDAASSKGAAPGERAPGESTLEVGPVVPEVPDPYIGTVLGERYRIISKLGAGGMGAVYLAEHVVIERKVAIKILSQDFATKADLVQRFIQEARAAAKIGHENIVEVYDFGETASGSVFFAMEYLEGRDLASVIQKGGAMQPQRVRPIVLQICRALQAAHGKQIIHRDLKPENIYLIEKEGRADFVKILDFGIAKITSIDENSGSGGGGGGGRLTRAGMIFGTPEYMSPEHARGEVPDHRVDIYALGCILYEMLTGRVPFQAETFMGTLTKHMFEMPEPPSRRAPRAVPTDLEAICLKAIDKERDRRFQTMQEFAQALEGEIQVPMPRLGPPPGMGMPQAPPPAPSLAPGMAFQQMQQMQLQMQMQLQAGMYPGAGQVQMPMAGSTSGMISGPQGPMVSAMNMAALPGYSTTAPPTSYEVSRQPNPAHWRRMVFILVGATIGVAVLSVLLFWPPPASQIPTRPANLAGPTPQPWPKRPTPTPLAPVPQGPARLTVKGLPDSRVFLDFKEVGRIESNGELSLDAPSPGTAEWSVHVKVVKDGHGEFATRVLLHGGSPMSIMADQPSTGGGSSRRHKR